MPSIQYLTYEEDKIVRNMSKLMNTMNQTKSLGRIVLGYGAGSVWCTKEGKENFKEEKRQTKGHSHLIQQDNYYKMSTTIGRTPQNLGN